MLIRVGSCYFVVRICQLSKTNHELTPINTNNEMLWLSFRFPFDPLPHFPRSPVFPYPFRMAEPKRAFSVISLRNHARPSGRLWNPAADVYQGTEGWLVKIDLAGVCPDELELLLEESQLIVRGCRRDTLYREGFTYQQMEITYSRFEKRVDFPCAIDSSSLKKDYRDGFLIVSFSCK